MSEQDFRERMHLEGHLSQYLTEHLWGHCGTLRLGGEDFEVIGSNEVPGYDENLDQTVLIRRKSDGKVFEVEIEPAVLVARAPTEEVSA